MGIKAYHKIENSDYEWIEYESEYGFTENKKEKTLELNVVNVLQNQPQLVQELKMLYGTEVDVAEYWIRVDIIRDSLGNVLSHKRQQHTCTPPIIRDGFSHMLVFTSKDKNYLEFIKWDIQKKLEDRTKLSTLVKDIKVPQEETVDIPNFLKEDSKQVASKKAIKPRSLRKEIKEDVNTSISEIFQEMDKLINDIFGKF